MSDRVTVGVFMSLLLVSAITWGQSAPRRSAATDSTTSRGGGDASNLDREYCYVEQARTETVAFTEDVPSYARLGNEIWVDVANLDRWLKARRMEPTSAVLKKFQLYLNGVAIPGAYPDTVFPEDQTQFDPPRMIYHLRYQLKRDNASREAWLRLLNQPRFVRQVAVSVGLEALGEVDTKVLRGQAEQKYQFFLVVIPRGWLVTGVAVLLAAVLAFWGLARRTDLLRDPIGPRRPDGARPYSLARMQMACWFFLVIGSYFFLWIVTGDKDTITSSVLALIGISAGTALGATVVDAGKGPDRSAWRNVPNVDLTRSRPEIVEALRGQQAVVQGLLAATDEALASILPTEKEKLEAKQRERDALRDRISDLGRQVDYFTWPSWKGLVYDLMGEENVISFHRFQIAVWTIVLGIIFCSDVYQKLAMPDFNGTLLGLMGISAGTYIGFKFPTASK